MFSVIVVDGVRKTYVKRHRGGMANYMWLDAIKGLFKKSHPTVQALNGVSLNVEQGSIVSILGPNGSGKTTLVKIICALLKPTTGSICIKGKDIVKNPYWTRQHISLIGSNAWVSFDMQLSVRENLEFWGRLYGLSGKELKQRITAASESLAITDRLNEPIRTLSSGLRQRVALAKGLLTQSPILVMDEPTVALDPDVAASFRKVVQELNRKHGITVLLTTHLMEEADHLSDTVYFLNEGKIVMQGSPAALKQSLNLESKTWLIYGDGIDRLVAALHSAAFVNHFTYKVNKMDMTLSLSTLAEPDSQAQLEAIIDSSGCHVLRSATREKTLEDVFFFVTGRRLNNAGSNSGFFGS